MQAVYHGMGLRVDPGNLTVEGITSGIHRLVSEPSFKQAALRVAARLTAGKALPSHRAAGWVEHVMGTKGDGYMATQVVLDNRGQRSTSCWSQRRETLGAWEGPLSTPVRPVPSLEPVLH